MSSIDNTINTLEHQRTELDKKLNTLIKERKNDLLKVLEAFPPGNLSTEIIIGGLYYVQENAPKDKQFSEELFKIGSKICSRMKIKEKKLKENYDKTIRTYQRINNNRTKLTSAKNWKEKKERKNDKS